MGPRVLFNQRDWYDAVEDRAAAYKRDYDRLPDDQALDEAFTQRMKEKLTFHVPTLFPDDMEYEQAETAEHRLDKHNLAVQMASQGQTATEFVFYVPFDGDPSVFDIRPTANNGTLAEGEIEGHKLLLRVQPLPGYDVKGHVSREIRNVNWRLDQLRGGLQYLDQQLEGARRSCVMARTKAVEARAKISLDLGAIPRRKPAPAPAPSAPSEPSAAWKPVASEKPVPETWDIFMSHASPDKPWVAGLVDALRESGVTVWFDTDSLEWGEDLQRGINRGLMNSRKAIAVLSKSYLAERKWTESEISGLLAREKLGETLILPLWHQITKEDLKRYNLILASRIGKVSDSDNYDEIVRAVSKALGRDRDVPKVGDTQPASDANSRDGAEKRELVAFAFYEQKGPGAKREKIFIRRSDYIRGGFVFINDNSEHDGNEDDIATKFSVADRWLKSQGYVRMQFSNPSNIPAFDK